VWREGGIHVDEELAGIAEEVADIIERANDGVAQTAVPIPPPAHNNPHAPKSYFPATSRPPKLLIVDDEASFREAVTDGLRDMNIIPFEADSVKEGMGLLDDNRDIRVILLDLDFKEGEEGTVLLDFIKDRASYYRVIILTSHTDMLAAEKASSYNIFSYLTKVEHDPPLQTLRFAVTRAIDDLRREETNEFGDNMLRSYPTPFIYIYEQLRSDMTPLEKLVSQKDMLELLLHFSAIILLCEYLGGGVKSDELDNQIRNRITKPALGDWFNIINEIAKRRNENSGTFFLDSFLTFFTGRNKKIIGDFISVRNKFVGHGTKHSDYEYETVVKRCSDWIESLLQDYRFITRFLLCYVLNVQIIKGKYIYSLKECLGSNPQLLKSTKPLNLLLNTHEMHLVSLNAEQSRSLYPFIILEICDECKQLEIFFYSKLSNNQLHYLSYRTGHWIVREEPVMDFLELIKPAQ
jgi:FixJ family two-component response regulator